MAASHVDRIERQISQVPPAAAIASGRRSVNRRSVDKADMNPCVPVSAHLHKITAIFPSFFPPHPVFSVFYSIFFAKCQRHFFIFSSIFSHFSQFFPFSICFIFHFFFAKCQRHFSNFFSNLLKIVHHFEFSILNIIFYFLNFPFFKKYFPQFFLNFPFFLDNVSAIFPS